MNRRAGLSLMETIAAMAVAAAVLSCGLELFFCADRAEGALGRGAAWSALAAHALAQDVREAAAVSVQPAQLRLTPPKGLPRLWRCGPDGLVRYVAGRPDVLFPAVRCSFSPAPGGGVQIALMTRPGPQTTAMLTVYPRNLRTHPGGRAL